MKHPYSVSVNLLKFLNEEKMCDVTLVAGDGKKIPAHRLFLSTATVYFYTLFKTPLEDQSKNEIAITNIDGATLVNVVRCFYTGTIEINVENVEALLAAASFLLFPHLEEKCTEFLARPGALNKLNCVGIWALARLYVFEDLEKLAFSFVRRHFSKIVSSEDFNRLNKSDLMELLEIDALQVDSEEEVFNAIVSWVEFDLVKRKPEFPGLIRCVRLNLLSSTFVLGRVLLASRQFDCEDAFLTLNESINSDEQKCKRSAKLDDDLLAINLLEEKVAIESYSLRSKQWTRMIDCTIDCGHFGTELVDNKLIIIGGFHSFMISNAVFSIDIYTNTRTILQPMVNERYDHSTIKLNGFIYVFGGIKGIGSLRVTERYDIVNDKWEMLPSMSVARAEPATAIYLGKIFVMGGSPYTADENSVENYDLSTNEWTSVASMIEKRNCARAGVSGDYLYLVGGENNGVYLSSIERYDPQSNVWTLISFQLNTPRSHFGMEVMQDWIFVAGGLNNGNELRSCEKLNLRTGEKEHLPSMWEDKTVCKLLFRLK